MKLIDRINKEVIVILVVAGLLFASTFIGMALLIDLENKQTKDAGSNNTQQVLDDSR
jgi:hypothetical protein|tara:strand:- start:6026 stop:6196 length:171 start_codon:yes stop_codon:yes gene_type:complete